MKNEKKRHSDWQLIFGISLVLLSAVIYFIHYLFFKDSHHVFIYLLGDIAFVPIEVLLVTLIIHRLLKKRERSIMLEKMNMLIGAFFSEAGTKLISYFSKCDSKISEIQNELLIGENWAAEQFSYVNECLSKHDYEVDYKNINLQELHDLLKEKRSFFLRLLENPYLLEHEQFTDLLWAVFHLTEELSHRENFNNLPETDSEHLAVDIRRIYVLLVNQWLEYMKHLKKMYPYLFSLAVRTNPFNKKASVIVR